MWLPAAPPAWRSAHLAALPGFFPCAMRACLGSASFSVPPCSCILILLFLGGCLTRLLAGGREQAGIAHRNATLQ